MSLNVIVIAGRLTRDPEIRMTSSEKSVASFTLAVERDFARPGEDRETDFISVSTWGKKAEFVERFFRKGSMMQVLGRLQIQKWVDNDGKNRKSAVVVADQVYFGEPKASGAAPDAGRREIAPPALPAAPEVPRAHETYEQPMFRDLDDDGQLPF